jgi:hypothetical protein
LILTRKEKEHLVISLASQGKTTREIAKAAHLSPLNIGKIIRRFTGEETVYQNTSPTITSKAFQMFKENKNRVDVAITLNLDADYVVTLYEDYLHLLNLDKLITIYKDLGDGIYLLDYLYHHMKCEGIVTKTKIS